MAAQTCEQNIDWFGHSQASPCFVAVTLYQPVRPATQATFPFV